MPKLYVGNLPRSITEARLEEFFTSLQYPVDNIKLIRDMDSGLPRGFAFVELAAGTDIEKAVQELNGQSIEGRQLVINEARPPKPFSGGGGGGGKRFGSKPPFGRGGGGGGGGGEAVGAGRRQRRPKSLLTCYPSS
ncbi:MAG: RNA-binding protein [Terriglobia bacterium]